MRSFFFLFALAIDISRTRLTNVRQMSLEDGEEDEVNMAMVLDQLQDLIDVDPPPWRGFTGGSCKGKSFNIERTKVIMNEQMFLDYFAKVSIWGLAFFRHCNCIRRSLLLNIIEKVCERDNYFVQKRDNYFVQKRDACGLVGLSYC